MQGYITSATSSLVLDSTLRRQFIKINSFILKFKNKPFPLVLVITVFIGIRSNNIQSRTKEREHLFSLSRGAIFKNINPELFIFYIPIALCGRLAACESPDFSFFCKPGTFIIFLYESSIVGSYSSINVSWTKRSVTEDFPTPPAPTTAI